MADAIVSARLHELAPCLPHAATGVRPGPRPRLLPLRRALQVMNAAMRENCKAAVQGLM